MKSLLVGSGAAALQHANVLIKNHQEKIDYLVTSNVNRVSQSSIGSLSNKIISYKVLDNIDWQAIDKIIIANSTSKHLPTINIITEYIHKYNCNSIIIVEKPLEQLIDNCHLAAIKLKSLKNEVYINYTCAYNPIIHAYSEYYRLDRLGLLKAVKINVKGNKNFNGVSRYSDKDPFVNVICHYIFIVQNIFNLGNTNIQLDKKEMLWDKDGKIALGGILYGNIEEAEIEINWNFKSNEKAWGIDLLFENGSLNLRNGIINGLIGEKMFLSSLIENIFEELWRRINDLGNLTNEDSDFIRNKVLNDALQTSIFTNRLCNLIYKDVS